MHISRFQPPQKGILQLQHNFDIYIYIWLFPKMVGFPNKPMGFPIKNDHFGVEIGGKPTI